MLMQLNRHLRDRAVVTAAILSLFGYDAASAAEQSALGGSNRNDRQKEQRDQPQTGLAQGRVSDRMVQRQRLSDGHAAG